MGARGSRVDGHTCPTASDLGTELGLERRYLRASGNHPGAQDAVDRSAFLVADDRLGSGDHAWTSVRVSSFWT
ncbi:unannotated protein [freshwater metagenome]|uniref:Unannotated protein n=1 Tax=freshwater metagenome TaxID=449393 RepID=A0A6J7BZK1_9ZZZZ